MPERVELETPVVEVILQPWGNALVARPESGEALVFGRWVLAVQTDRLPDSSMLTPVRMPFVTDEPAPYFEGRRLFLTDEGIVLDHATRDQMRVASYFGNNWIELSHNQGFTRDGTFWQTGYVDWERELSLARRLATWLHLSYSQNEQGLIPGRWRMKRVELQP
jgi:hypothetical protein